MVGYLHIVPKCVKGDKYICFDPLSKTIFLLDPDEMRIVEKARANLELNPTEQKILGDIQNSIDSERKNVTEIVIKEKGPRMMVLMVSQICNMNCRYCYAHGGTYNTPGIMKFEVGKQALDAAHELGIDKIQFYGGEPLMNFGVINRLVQYADKMDYKFRFGIITNGTLINKEIANFFRDHDFDVTVSIDGPKIVNDTNRIYPNGLGSYDDIINSIRLLNELDIPLALEVTYAKNYLHKMGISEILDHLSKYSKTFIVGYALPPVWSESIGEPISTYALNENEVLEIMKELVDYLFDKWERGVPIKEMGVCRILREILSPVRYVRRTICSEIPFRITVFYNGEVYPCHQTYLDSNFYLGNITDTNFPKSLKERLANTAKVFSLSNLYIAPEDKWMPSLCDFCRIHLIKRGGLYYLRYPKAYRDLLDHILYGIVTRDIKTIIKTLGGVLYEQ